MVFQAGQSQVERRLLALDAAQLFQLGKDIAFGIVAEHVDVAVLFVIAVTGNLERVDGRADITQVILGVAAAQMLVDPGKLRQGIDFEVPGQELSLCSDNTCTRNA